MSKRNEAFNRQMNVPGWDDDVISRQVALVLGVGGIGTNVALLLARLGVHEIILTDRDTVDVTNLNRQLLFGPQDVGSKKVDAAKRNLDALHAQARPTLVTALNVDFVSDWGAAVKPLFGRATVVFNACDIGEAFDRLVGDCCRVKGIPYIAGASYANHADFECFSNNSSKERGSIMSSCASCRLGSTSTALAHALRAEHTLSAGCADLAFLPHDKKPETGTVGSSVLTCSCAAQFCVNSWVNGALFPSNGNVNNNCFGMIDLNGGEGGPQMNVFPVERDANCGFCGDVAPCCRPEGRFALAFGSEPVLLSAVPGRAFAPPSETKEQERHRIAQYRAFAEQVRAKERRGNNNDDDAPEKEILPALNAQPGTTATYLMCPPAVPLDASITRGPHFGGAHLTQEFSMLSSSSSSSSAANSKNNVSSVLTTPLVKAPNGSIHATRSGRRSAVLPHKQGAALDRSMAPGASLAQASPASVEQASFGALRVKGCGCVTHESVAASMLPYAFPLKELDAPEMRMMLGPDVPPRMEIRGCQFLESALREQLLSRKIADLLAPSSFLLGNYPAAYWEYAQTDEMNTRELAISPDSYGNIRKFCGVFHTLGDKRAETHLLTGLELVIALMVRSSNKNNNSNNNTNDVEAFIRGVFPAGRVDCKTGELLPYWNRRKGPVMEGTSKALGESAVYREWERAAIASLADESLVNPIQAASTAWAPLWRETVNELSVIAADASSSSSSSSSASFLGYIAERLGYEMGFFHGALNGAGISWGLFFDHNPCEPHNNAHPNNFLVVAASCASQRQPVLGEPAPQLLAACDFDMAYTRDEFISHFSGGTQDLELFDSNIEWERREMRSVLGGNNMQSTGIVAGAMESRLAQVLLASDAAAQSADREEEAMRQEMNALLNSTSVQGLRILMREMCVVALENGAADGAKWVASSAVPTDMRQRVTSVQHEKVLRLMLRLSLMLTAHMNC